MKTNKHQKQSKGYTLEEYDRSLKEQFARFGISEKVLEITSSSTSKPKTYHISFKPKKTK